ncbi:OsmC family protein [Nocardioides sp.]|uniref:OsmC family protein n=1 Tax=Nocardioides sp. TaxID=35761 RepID=UPI0035283DF0
MTQDNHRSVRLHKIGEGRYLATNARGGVLPIGSGADPDFTPSELLLAALVGCTSIDLDFITRKRATAVVFEAEASGEKVRDDGGNRLSDLRLVFDLRFPDDEAGDAARAILPRALAQSRERLCTVGRTVAAGEAADYRLGELAAGDAD